MIRMNSVYRHYSAIGLEEEMEKELGVTDARRQFSSIIDEVRYRGDNYVIVKYGEPAAAIVPISLYRKWQHERQEVFNVIREIREMNQEADPDQVMQKVLKAQQAVRQARASQQT